MNSYPTTCYRGISSKEALDTNGTPLAALFQFSLPPNKDNFIEESINWNDHSDSLSLLLSQKKKDGTIQFKEGAAVLETAEIDKIKKIIWIKDMLSYERNILPDNAYHGNILLSSDLSKSIRRQVSAILALTAVVQIIPNHNV